jgi:hypothetical protein
VTQKVEKRDSPEVAAARIEVERRRGRLMDKAHQLQHRLSPNVIARDAWDGAKEKGAALAEDAVDAVRSRPVAAGGILAAITMFLAREPLMELAGSVAQSVGAKRKRKSKAKTATSNKKTQDNDKESVA